MTVLSIKLRWTWERLAGIRSRILSPIGLAIGECQRMRCGWGLGLLVLLMSYHPSVALAQASPPPVAVLEGGVVVQAAPDLLGVWNVDLKKLHRHPRIVIQDIQNNFVSGTYSGKFGTFPLRGTYDAGTGNVTLSVDFSESPLSRIRRLARKSLVAEFQGKIEDGMLRGIASMPDVTKHTVAWEAKKAR